MRRICENCRKTYDDFDHMTICPHDKFAISSSAAEHLAASGIPLESIDGDPREPTEAEKQEFDIG